MLRPSPIEPVPEVTARMAHDAFPKGHPYLHVADAIGILITDVLFADAPHQRGKIMPPGFACTPTRTGSQSLPA